MSLVVANGSVVTPDGVRPLDVRCVDGRIAGLEPHGSADPEAEILDVTGMLVFPGFIDPHVHSRDPGLTDKGDFAHATLGALLGGTTTVIEMPNAVPAVDSAAVFDDRRRHHAASAWVDYALWGMSVGDANLGDLTGMVDRGAAAVKLFWGYAQRRDTRQLVYRLDEYPDDLINPPPDNGTVLAVFAEMAAAGGLLAAHCEDRSIIAARERALGRPVGDYHEFLSARPPVAEAVAVATAAEMARATGCRFHVVHLSSAAGVNAVRTAREQGIAVTAETCPHYLTLTDKDYPRVGPMMKIYPPVRTGVDQRALWEAVRDGTITSIGSDHAPHSVADKRQSLAEQPAGIAATQTFGPVMADALARGLLTPRRFAEVMATDTARLYGLYPRKGVILPGSDADLTIVDPSRTRTLRNTDLVAKHPLSPWDGTLLRGQPVAAILRGRPAMRDGEPIGQRRGQFLPAGTAVGSGTVTP